MTEAWLSAEQARHPGLRALKAFPKLSEAASNIRQSPHVSKLLAFFVWLFFQSLCLVLMPTVGYYHHQNFSTALKRSDTSLKTEDILH